MTDPNFNYATTGQPEIKPETKAIPEEERNKYLWETLFKLRKKNQALEQKNQALEQENIYLHLLFGQALKVILEEEHPKKFMISLARYNEVQETKAQQALAKR